jgi:hypothetical protein
MGPVVNAWQYMGRTWRHGHLWGSGLSQVREGARAILSGYKIEVRGEAGNHLLRGLKPQCATGGHRGSPLVFSFLSLDLLLSVFGHDKMPRAPPILNDNKTMQGA